MQNDDPKTSRSTSGEKSRSQRQRFIDAAKDIEADETGEAFEKAFGKIVPPVKGKNEKHT